LLFGIQMLFPYVSIRFLRHKFKTVYLKDEET